MAKLAKLKQFVLGELSDRERLVIFVGFALAVAFRIPRIVLEGRLWAEEGRVFFEHAQQTSWASGVFWSVGGYLNLVATTASVLAQSVPLLLVPRLTFLIALIFQLLPGVLLIWSRASWLLRRWMVLAGLWLVLSTPGAEEVWLHTLHSQFHLSLCVCLVLISTPRSVRMSLLSLFVLALAPLSGPGAALITPLFGLRAFLDRSGSRAIQFGVLATSSAIQFLGFYVSIGERRPLSPALALDLLTAKHVLLPLGGYRINELFRDRLVAMVTAGCVSPGIALIAVLALLALAGVVVKGHPEARWLVACAAILIGITYWAPFFPGPAMVLPHVSGRYTYVPQVLLALTALASASLGTRLARVAQVLVLWLTLVGIEVVWDVGDFFTSGNKWSDEIAVWEKDHTHAVGIWPHGWQMTIIEPIPR